METRQFKKGDVIFKEGTFGNTMYELKSGAVGIYAAYGAPGEKKLTELEAGRIFGEMGVIEVRPRSATAVALSDIETIEVSTADMQEYFSSQPEKLMEIMRGMSRRLRELTADYQEVCGTLGEWKETTEQGKKKGSGLLAAIKKFADAYAEGAKYMTDHGLAMYNDYALM
ncbi:MAG: cyclic nucleotide-binding domain-containing protein [Oscillospiraceae bacterium]|nr:cyclic nucleotide-binding domain-containing protein [Oscillospiraceae bacterium]